MQKIIEQKLDGSKEHAEQKAQYTWEKGEIVYVISHNTIVKGKMTGDRWLSGNKWGYRKIYQYEVLDCPEDASFYKEHMRTKEPTHDNEEHFYSSIEDAHKAQQQWAQNIIDREVEWHKERQQKIQTFVDKLND